MSPRRKSEPRKHVVTTLKISEVEEGTIELSREGLITLLQESGCNLPADAEVSVETCWEGDTIVADVFGTGIICVSWKKITPKVE